MLHGKLLLHLVIAHNMFRNASNQKKISDLINYVYIFKIMHVVLYNYLLFHKHGVILTFKQKVCSDLRAD